MGAHEARERAIADSQFGGGQTNWSPAVWYVGLSRTAPNNDGTGFTEPSGGNYARVPVTNNSTNWPPAETVGGVTVKSNGQKITFDDPSGDWGNLSHYGLFTTATGGTPEYSNPLDQAISVKSGNKPVEFDVGQLALTWA